jgi:peptidoglycan/LPS O-acetylase OafA/YrhL
MGLYKLHIIAFPLGIIFAWLFHNYHRFTNLFSQRFSQFLGYKKPLKLSGTIKKVVEANVFKQTVRYLFMTVLAIIIVYTSYHSGVGNIDQARVISIITMLAFLFFFLSMRFEFKLLDFIGFYSYEIYLLHWPILYRYDIFYRYLPAGIATVLYLILFLILAWVLHKITDRILKRETKRPRSS